MEQRFWIKTVPWLLEKPTENLACLPCWHLAWWNFIHIRNGKKYCELHKKYVNRVKNENYSPTLKSRHNMALHRNVSSTKFAITPPQGNGQNYCTQTGPTILQKDRQSLHVPPSPHLKRWCLVCIAPTLSVVEPKKKDSILPVPFLQQCKLHAHLIWKSQLKFWGQ